jgi:hypothetical protein
MSGPRAVWEAIGPPRDAFGSKGAGVSGCDPEASVARAESPFPERPQAVDIPQDCVVVEVALHDRLEPLARGGAYASEVAA